MSLHKTDTPAEKFAAHLESAYGVQLDPFRHQALVNELEAFAAPPAPVEAPKPPKTPRAKKQQEKINAD